MPVVSGDCVVETRIGGVTLVASGASRFAAVAFEGDTILERIEGQVDVQADAAQLLNLAEATAVITDSSRRGQDLLGRIGVHSAQIWDVLELASLLAPNCPSGDLDRAAAFFGIVANASGLSARAERALMLFQLLLATLDRVDTQTLLHASRLAVGLDWPLRALFAEVLRRRALSSLETGALAAGAPIGAWVARGAPGRRKPKARDAPEPGPIDVHEVSQYLAPEGAIARVLAGYEVRAEQVHMAELVTGTLNEGGQLLLEAGTGTGKSLAYLLPAALQALRGGRRALVSTATTTLQDQLFEHDLPLVQAGLAAEREAIRATVLKGRANYLCLQRWQSLLHAGDLGPADRMLLIKTLFWLSRTTTGDRAELHLTPAEEDAWSRVSAVTEACTPLRCAYHRIGVCYLARARRAAEESHVVIANHALLLSDLATRSRVLPDYDVLVVDEAHHLEDEATQQLGWRLGERELLNRLERVLSPTGGGGGAIVEAMALIRASGELQAAADLRTALEIGERAAMQLASAIQRFFEHLARLIDDPDVTQLAGGDDMAVRLTGAVRAGSAWQEIEHTWAAAATQQQKLEGTVAEVIAQLEALLGSSETARALASELGGHLDYWRDVRQRLHAGVHQPGPGAVYWISSRTSGRFRSVVFNAAPLEVAGLLRDRLFAAPETSILVSATLAIDGSFEYVKSRLGLEDARGEQLGSPFDYQHAALLYVPNDLPDPTQSGYQDLAERTILDVVTRLDGRTLVLFTSRAQLRATYQGLRGRLADKRITVLGQGIDETSRTRLLERFRHGSGLVLFGTNAFWEGIDVVGDALSCVIVTRLPFAVPTDPIHAARAEQFDDPFDQYAVPQAVLRLKQGFGRLIRSRTDRGAVVVLDRRLVTRFYGQVFLRSLPSCSVKQGPAARTALEVSEWVAPATQLTLQVAPG